MKACVNTYSFGGYVSQMGMLNIIDKAADMGFEGIEFVDANWNHEMDLSLAAQCREKAQERGIAVVAYCTGADFLHFSDGNLDAEVERVCRQVDFAKALGAPLMRHDIASAPCKGNGLGKAWGIGYDDVLPRLAEGTRRVAEYAMTQGIGTMTENHGFFSQDACRVEKLINAVDHENFGALVDIGNFLCADERPEVSVGLLARYCKHVHCKDFFFKSGREMAPGKGWFQTRAGNYLRSAILGSGSVPVAQCLSTLRRAGYDGFVSLEFEGIEDRMLGVEWGLEFLKQCLN